VIGERLEARVGRALFVALTQLASAPGHPELASAKVILLGIRVARMRASCASPLIEVRLTDRTVEVEAAEEVGVVAAER
jgi:hypothetical protein